MCLMPVPALACVVRVLPGLGVKPRGKPKGLLFRPGATGEGKAGWVNVSEPSFDVSSPPHPGTGCLAGVNRGLPL